MKNLFSGIKKMIRIDDTYISEKDLLNHTLVSALIILLKIKRGIKS